MKYRKLRIAWSVASGIACLLLIALWVRSYWTSDMVEIADWYEIGSGYGEIIILPYDPTISTGWPWTYFSFPLGDNDMDGQWQTTLGFGRTGSPAGTGITFPLWFPIFLLAVLGAVTSIRWRFNVRTLLIATTLVAVTLGLAVYAVRTH